MESWLQSPLLVGLAGIGWIAVIAAILVYVIATDRRL